MKGKINWIVFSVGALLMTLLYTVPFFLEGVARRHLMFIRLLEVWQHRWSDMTMEQIGYSLLVVGILIIALILFKTKRFPYPTICLIGNAISLMAVLVVLNIDPFAITVFYLLLHTTWVAAVISFITTGIISFCLHKEAGHAKKEV